MTIVITTFEHSPDGGKGLGRDTRVRWALEEAGQPYEVRLLSFTAMKAPEHLALQPFGQIPTYEENGLVLFETGAIVLHIAVRHGELLPESVDARARAIAWMFAALNTMEAPVLDLVTSRFLEGDKPWAQARLPLVHERIRVRLGQLSQHLGDDPWLDGLFSAGDLLMVSVLLRFSTTWAFSVKGHRSRGIQGFQPAERDAPTGALAMSLQVEQQHGEAVFVEYPSTLNQVQPACPDAMHQDDRTS